MTLPLKSIVVMLVLVSFQGLVLAEEPTQAGKQLVQLIAQLQSKDANNRIRAAQEIGSIGPDARSATASLVSLLGDTDPVANAAETALWQIGPDVVPEIKGALKSDNSKVRMQAIEVLVQLGPKAKEAVPDLIEKLKNGSDKVEKTKAVFALEKIGKEAKPAIPAITDLLETNDWELQWIAASALADIDPPAAKDAVPKLIEFLNTQRAHPRFVHVCALALSKIGIEKDMADGAVAPLLICLKDTKVGDLNYFSDALATIGKSAVPGLIKMMDDQELTTRILAIGTLARIGPDAKGSIPKLLEILNVKEDALRYSTLFALAGVGTDSAEVIPLIEKTLAAPYEKDSADLYWVAKGLAYGGVSGTKFLLSGIKQKDSRVRSCCILAFANATVTPEVIPALIAALHDQDENFRTSAIFALGEIGDEAKAALPALQEFSRTEKKERYRTSSPNSSVIGN